MAVEPFTIGYLQERDNDQLPPQLEPLQLRFEEALAAGELDRPVEIIVERGHGLPTGSAHLCQQAWQRLSDAGVLVVIGPGNTDNALAVKRQADADGLCTINWSGSEHTRSEYLFHYQLGSLPDEGPLIASAVTAAGHRRVAVIRDRSPIGDEYWSYFQEATAPLGLSVVSDQRISPVATDLASAVAVARDASADALVYLGFGGVFPVLWGAMADASWTVPAFTNTAGLHWYGLPEAVRVAGAGWVYVDMYDERNDVTNAMFDRFEARFGTRPVGPIVPAMYDMASLVVGALRHAPVLTREGIKEGLERVHRVPAACGGAGTEMGFGPWERTALKGADYLVFRVMGATATERYGAYPPSYERLAAR